MAQSADALATLDLPRLQCGLWSIVIPSSVSAVNRTGL